MSATAALVWRVGSGRPGRGPVEVLVGLDGSAEATAALVLVAGGTSSPAQRG
jgi:hypothetical protein